MTINKTQVIYLKYLVLENQAEESVNSINQYFKLNDFEQNKLGLK